MSGISGIYNLDGRDVDRDLLARMNAAIAHRGPDGSGKWVDRNVGFGHQMLATTPESLREVQPFYDDDLKLCLTFDGRIDNRGEIRDALKDAGARLRTDTDAEMVLMAYRYWGTACPEKILGDFSFALWDGGKRRLFCARDILGIRPFYYHFDGRAFLFGSELQQILKVPYVPREPNEGMIGEVLVSAVNNKEETLFKGILRLPPAHFLIVEPGRLRKQTYWKLKPEKEIRYRSDQEYADHFLEIFTEAVRCRMRTADRVGSQLSGGLDSSAVSCVAQSLIRSGAVSGNSFETFSIVFPGWICDESEYSAAVNRKWRIQGNAKPPKIRKRFGYEAQVDRYLDIPDYPNGTMSDSIENLAKEKGFTVLLTGLGGDEWFTGSQYHYCDLLRKFQIKSLIRQVRQDFGLYSVIPFPSKPLLKFSLRPLIPENILRGLRNLTHRSDTTPAWIEPAFARSICLPERMRRKVDWRRFSSCAQAAQYTASTSGFQTHAIEMEERSASYFGIELRHPFHDRRILEFGMAIPEEQRCRGHCDKFILRRAMRDYFPETVLQRQSKAEFSQVFKKALQAQGDEGIFDSLSIAATGWVNATKIQRMYKQFKQVNIPKDEEIKIDLWPFWHIFGIDIWFNRVYKKRRSLSENFAIGRKTATG